MTRRRALEASVAPGADIYLSYEESEALWAAGEELGVQQVVGSSVVRTISLGPAMRPLHSFVTEAPETTGVGSTLMALPLFGVSPLVSSSSAEQVPFRAGAVIERSGGEPTVTQTAPINPDPDLDLDPSDPDPTEQLPDPDLPEDGETVQPVQNPPQPE
jgi:hypothetical protein